MLWKKKPSVVDYMAFPGVTWTEFVYLILSSRLIGLSAHKQVMRIQLDICEILGQKAFLACPWTRQGEMGPAGFETRGFRDNISRPIVLPNHAAHMK